MNDIKIVCVIFLLLNDLKFTINIFYFSPNCSIEFLILLVLAQVKRVPVTFKPSKPIKD